MGIPSRRVSCGLHIEFPMSNQKYAHKKGNRTRESTPPRVLQ